MTYGTEYGINAGEDLTKEAAFYNNIKILQFLRGSQIFFNIPKIMLCYMRISRQ